MDDFLMQYNGYSWVIQWIAAVLVIMFCYAIVNQVVKIFSKMDEEMWEK